MLVLSKITAPLKLSLKRKLKVFSSLLSFFPQKRLEMALQEGGEVIKRVHELKK